MATFSSEGETMKLIPKNRIAPLTAEIERIQRRAVRLGVHVPGLVIGATMWRLIEVGMDHNGDCCVVSSELLTERPDAIPGNASLIEVVEVEVEGGTVAVDGWSLEAVIEPIADGANQLRAVPGREALPERFRTATMECDHCKKSRKRGSVVVLSKGGEYAQIGRQCVRDYIGHDPQALFLWLTTLEAMLGSLAKESDEEDERGAFGGGGWASAQLSTVGVLGRAATIVALDGYRKGKTSIIVQTSLCPPRNRADADSRDELSRYRPVTPEEEQRGEELRVWVAGGALGQSDYAWNCKVFCAQPSLDHRGISTVVSVAQAWRREYEAKQALPEPTAPSEYVGKVGERLDGVTIFVEKVIKIEGEWGITHLHIIRVGNDVLKWFATSRRLDVGEHTAKFTVKAHSMRDGEKQTIVSRLTTREPK